jgi:hypothetical protein
VREGTAKFLIGSAVGAVGGFAVGSFVATPTARSAGKSALGGLIFSAGFVGRTVIRATRGFGAVLESGYTRVRGREKYLEHEIEELRDQITRLEQRMD